jgi:hypothetical protein
LFFIFGNSHFIARLLPALVGSFLVLVPILFRPLLGEKPSLILAFGLALDPGLIAVSRITGSPVLALVFVLSTLGFWYKRKFYPAAICAVLTFLSGVPFLIGVMSILVTGIVIWLLKRINDEILPDINPKEGEILPSSRNLAYFFIVGFFVLSTFFFHFPQGLGGFAKTFPAFLNEWSNPLGVPILAVLLMFVVYQPLALLFGIMGVVHSWWIGDGIGKVLSIWLCISLLVILLYPARQMLDIVWILVPLWTLAAREISLWLEYIPGEDFATLGQTVLIFILASLGWLNLVGLILPMQNPELIRTRGILIIGVVILGLLATLLVGLGWSYRIAQKGLVWACLLSLGLYSISGTWAVVRARPSGEGAPSLLASPITQWLPAPSIGSASILLQTVNDLAEWHTGNRNILDMMVLSQDPVCETCIASPSMQWLLRNIRKAQIVDTLSREMVPSVVITSGDQIDQQLSTSYRGEKLLWKIYPDWEGAISDGLLRWVLYRDVPAKAERIIIWARSDIFPGSQGNTKGNTLIQNPPTLNNDINVGSGKQE